MKHEFLDWLQSRAAFRGLAAWCVRLPDRHVLNRSCVDWLTETQTEQAFGRALNAAESLPALNPKPSQICWTFDNLRLYFGRGPKGSCIALLVENKPESEFAQAEALLDEFAEET